MLMRVPQRGQRREDQGGLYPIGLRNGVAVCRVRAAEHDGLAVARWTV
jgi:hypothetical protein